MPTVRYLIATDRYEATDGISTVQGASRAEALERLVIARGEQTDGKDWTPLDLLRKMVEKVESGEIQANKVFVGFESPGRDDDHLSYPWAQAGGTLADQIALMEIMLFILKMKLLGGPE